MAIDEAPLARFQRQLGQRTAELMKDFTFATGKHIGSVNIDILDVKSYDDPYATVVGLVSATVQEMNQTDGWRY